jgi:rod shape-determining protein MreD
VSTVRSARPAVLLLAVLAAYLLTLLPLPGVLLYAKPFWLGLLIIWISLERPAHGGLGLAFATGLGADLLLGTWFGEHAFRLVVLAFIVRRFRPRLRFFTLWQQTLAIGVLLLNDRVVVLMLRSFAAPVGIDLPYWLPALSGMLLWPLLVVLADDIGRRLRASA